jgi:transcriptional regulator with XRE-family HTH domain
MSDATTDNPFARRRAAGAFLRSRRGRLAPSEVGLSQGFHRRTPGLRREEVAMLAGVGTTWYTWLEQRREIQPSNEVLSALAEVLRLDPAERHHFFSLYDRQAIGRALDLPVEPRPREHFGWLAGFVGADAPVSSARTRVLTGWKPTGPTLLADLAQPAYFAS